jgi:hypothetical protein
LLRLPRRRALGHTVHEELEAGGYGTAPGRLLRPLLPVGCRASRLECGGGERGDPRGALPVSWYARSAWGRFPGDGGQEEVVLERRYGALGRRESGVTH